MALSASFHSPASASAGLTDRHERQRAFQAARRHSRLVRRLRLLLPLSGALVVVALVAATRLALPVDLDLAVAGLSVTRNSIIMEDPHITGFDADEREYSVTADRAVQALTNPNAVRLEDIAASITVAGHGTAKIRADSGDFDNGESTLRLNGEIAVDSSEGYSLRMHDAAIDLRAGSLDSANPVTLRYEDSLTTGGSISVSGGGRVIVLGRGVRTTLMPPRRQPPAQPAKE